MNSQSCVPKDVILVTGADLAPQAVSMLAGFEMIYAGKDCNEEKLVELCRQCDPVAIIARYGKISARVIETCTRLRVISKHRTGIDMIDSAAANARGIAVKAAAGTNAAAVAEHPWALILACAKNVVCLDGRMRAGHWDKATHKSMELKGRTLGVLQGRLAHQSTHLERPILKPSFAVAVIIRRLP